MFPSKLQGHLYMCLCPLGGTVSALGPAGEVPDPLLEDAFRSSDEGMLQGVTWRQP